MAINCALLVRLIQLLVEVRETSWQLNAQTVRFGAEERISDWVAHDSTPAPSLCACQRRFSCVRGIVAPRKDTNVSPQRHLSRCSRAGCLCVLNAGDHVLAELSMQALTHKYLSMASVQRHTQEEYSRLNTSIRCVIQCTSLKECSCRCVRAQSVPLHSDIHTHTHTHTHTRVRARASRTQIHIHSHTLTLTQGLSRGCPDSR
jgi:hypothetical protein